jgi:hypothetical protein
MGAAMKLASALTKLVSAPTNGIDASMGHVATPTSFVRESTSYVGTLKSHVSASTSYVDTLTSLVFSSTSHVDAPSCLIASPTSSSSSRAREDTMAWRMQRRSPGHVSVLLASALSAVLTAASGPSTGGSRRTTW